MFVRAALILIIVLAVLNNGWGMLIEKCSDKNYISSEAEYIVEGSVERIDSQWEKGKTRIVSRLNLKVEKYIKGASLPQNKLAIVLEGGCVGKICQWVEDQPDAEAFKKGQKIIAYLKKINQEFRLVCGSSGILSNEKKDQKIEK